MSAAQKQNEASGGESSQSAANCENFVGLYTKGVERLAEIQKSNINIAVQQSKEALAVWSRLTEKVPGAPRVKFFEQAAEGLERLAEVQKTLSDIAVDQTHTILDLVKERTTAAEKAGDSALNFAQQTFARSVAAQKKAAAATVNEAKSTIDNAREHFGFPGGEAVADTIKKGIDTVIDAHKELLETVSA